MQIFALRDEMRGATDLAYLECFEHPRAFYFELPPAADPWCLPFILHEFALRGTFTVDGPWSRRWVESRLVPPERQNLGEILRVNGLDEYDELRLLELTQGRCAQDDCYLVPVPARQLPEWYRRRVELRARDVFALADRRLVMLLADGTTLLCDLGQLLANRREFRRVYTDSDAFGRVTLQPGGHGISWGERLHISVNELRQQGTFLPLGEADVALLATQTITLSAWEQEYTREHTQAPIPASLPVSRPPKEAISEP